MILMETELMSMIQVGHKIWALISWEKVNLSHHILIESTLESFQLEIIRNSN